jgi:hypothetical protein
MMDGLVVAADLQVGDRRLGQHAKALIKVMTPSASAGWRSVPRHRSP